MLRNRDLHLGGVIQVAHRYPAQEQADAACGLIDPHTLNALPQHDQLLLWQAGCERGPNLLQEPCRGVVA